MSRLAMLAFTLSGCSPVSRLRVMVSSSTVLLSSMSSTSCVSLRLYSMSSSGLFS